MPLEDPPPYTDTQVAQTSSHTASAAPLTPNIQVNPCSSVAMSPNKSNLFDYRFSTFLPPVFTAKLNQDMI